jgi:hypothetical protein
MRTKGTKMNEYHQPTECEICEEELEIDEHDMYLDEVGEFWDTTKNTGVLAHAQCGIDAGLPLA